MSNKAVAGEIVYSLIQAMKNIFGMSGACRFEPSCAAYAAEAVKKLPLHRAVLLSAWRVLRCNPVSKPGYDPVPEK